MYTSRGLKAFDFISKWNVVAWSSLIAGNVYITWASITNPYSKLLLLLHHL